MNAFERLVQQLQRNPMLMAARKYFPSEDDAPSDLGEAIGFLLGKHLPSSNPPIEVGPPPTSPAAIAVTLADVMGGPRPAVDVRPVERFEPPQNDQPLSLEGRLPNIDGVPVWALPGGFISVPGGEEGLARIRRQAQEWIQRQQGGSDFDLSLPAAPPLRQSPFRKGAQFPAKEIARDWGTISEREDLERRAMRSELEDAENARANQRMLTLARVSEIGAQQKAAAQAQQLLQMAARTAHELAANGVPARDPRVMESLAPFWEQLASMGALPARFPDWSTFYAHIKRNYGMDDDAPPITSEGGGELQARERLRRTLGLS